MSYDRRSDMDRRAHLHYEGVDEDAAWIAGEVIRHGRSTGWVEEASERAQAAEIEGILARYNIGYVGNGVWAHHAGGTRSFRT